MTLEEVKSEDGFALTPEIYRVQLWYRHGTCAIEGKLFDPFDCDMYIIQGITWMLGSIADIEANSKKEWYKKVDERIREAVHMYEIYITTLYYHKIIYEIDWYSKNQS